MATGIAGAKRPVSQTRRPESAGRLGLPAAASVRIAGSACLALGMVLGATQASRAATSGERAFDAVITVAPASARLSAAVRDLLMSELGTGLETGAVLRREDLIRIADGDDDDGGGNDDDDDGGGGNDDDDDGDGSPTGPDDDDDGGGRGNDDDDDGGSRGNDDDDDGGRLSPPPRGSSDDDD